MKVLLGKGYFPKELPAPFTTADFGRESRKVLDDWLALKLVERKQSGKIQGKFKSGSYAYKIMHTEPEVISSPKRGFERRNLHIVHPIPQGFLTAELSYNWKSVQKWLLRQTYTLDAITVSAQSFRGIPELNFEAHRARKAFVESTANWLVKTDISRFYPTIYTHSIPWAAYGKETVKAKLKLYEGSFADRLDQLSRACNRNQTIGIPIGPETSRVIAEIISSRVDSEFKQAPHSVPVKDVDRLQDDWFIGCRSLEQADLCLSNISLAYRHFGLEINGSKTSIERVSTISEQEWVSELGSFLAHCNGTPSGKRLAEFLSLGVRMQVAAPHQPVTNFVLAVIENSKISKFDAATVESFLLRAMSLSPSSLPGITRVMLNLNYDTKAVSSERVGARAIEELTRHASNGNTLKVIWLLFMLRGLSIRVPVTCLPTYIAEMTSSAVCLILLDIASRKGLKGTLPASDWSNRITDEVTRTSGLWLLAYEGIRHRWLADPHNLSQSDFFKPMLLRNIVFYDERRNVPSTQATVKRRRRARAKARRATYVMIQDLRGFEDEGY